MVSCEPFVYCVGPSVEDFGIEHFVFVGTVVRTILLSFLIFHEIYHAISDHIVLFFRRIYFFPRVMSEEISILEFNDTNVDEIAHGGSKRQ